MEALRTLRLAGTALRTTPIGFGCARLFRLACPGDRRAVLESAYEYGIRHFDLAPMYGLGEAEPLFGAVMHHHRETITIATKFGIAVRVVGRAIAKGQRPLRSLLVRHPRLSRHMEVAGGGPGAGLAGRVLYASSGFGAEEAKRSLERSLRALRTDYIDIFLLHDPPEGLVAGADALVDFLEAQRDAGRIRSWGIAGTPGETSRGIADIGAAVVQVRSDIFDAPSSLPSGVARITYGALGRAIPLLQQYFASFPAERDRWSDRLAADLDDPRSLPTLLLADALRRNQTGPVLFSSTRTDRVRLAAGVVSDGAMSPERHQALRELALAVKEALPVPGVAS